MPNSSKASTSARSESSTHLSSSSSARVKAATAKARLIAEAKGMAAMRAIEEEELKLQQKKRDFELKLEIAKAEAEERALDDLEEKSPSKNGLPIHQSEDKVDHWLNYEVPTHPPVLTPQVQMQVPNHLPTPNHQAVDAQRQMIDTMLLPKGELIKFNGDPLEYWVFMQSFDCTIGNATVATSAKFNRLLQYCEGEARDVIRCCAMMEPEEGYFKARQLLRDRFGNDYQISETWVRRLTDGPRVMPGDRRAMQKIADDLTSCTLALSAMDKLEEVDTKRSLGMIIRRLPMHLQTKWRSKAIDHLDKTGRYPNITKLVDFLGKAAREANDPVYGFQERTTKEMSNFKKGSNFSIHATSPSDQRIQPSKGAYYKQSCPLCSKGHPLAECAAFSKMMPAERLEVARKHRLCFNCLTGKRHFARRCDQGVCGVQGCKVRHSKLLHDVFQAYSTSVPTLPVHGQQVGATSLACGAGQEMSKVALPVVTVIVKGHGREEGIKTHALLDPGSNKSFCSMELVRMLDIQGSPQALSLDTLNKDSQVETLEVALTVSGNNEGSGKNFHLPHVYALREFPKLRDSCATQEDLRHYKHLKDIPVPRVSKEGVTLLIGQDAPQLLIPLEVRHGEEGEPYAVRSSLGWTINGPLGCSTSDRAVSHFVNGNLEAQVERFWKLDTGETLANDSSAMSVNDKRAVEIWTESISMVDGHYQLALPFKSDSPDLPDNKSMAEGRLRSLGKRLTKNPELHERYAKEISNLIKKGFAEEVPVKELDASPGRTWYLPHHSVINPNKPEKLRVVFDCAAKCHGISLNDVVLQGPDMTNKLVGVLLRFREHKVGMMGDIEQMFHQVRVQREHRDVLRFVWWPNGDTTQPPDVFRMTVHLFGGVWSPSCANFALRRTAEDSADKFNAEAAVTVKDNFYVDDCLKSMKSEDDAVLMVKQLTNLLATGGFRLTKWISNSRRVLEAIPPGERAKVVQDLDLDRERLPVERALGVHWDTERDILGIKIKSKSKSHTKRGLLSIICSVYDPLGFVCPYILRAKILFQNECGIVGKGWDDPLEANTQEHWAGWLEDLSMLDSFAVERCLVPDGFGQIRDCRLHHFSDASQDGSVSYIRLVNAGGDIHCSFLIGKSRLAPLKTMTIPRLELSAAVVAVRMDKMLRRELRLEVQGSTFWTDSTLVLQYIKNQSRRFHTFVANRISVIHDGSTASQWKYVNTELNPADDASRGLDAKNMLNQVRWRKGPDFLWQDEATWPVTPETPNLLERDNEVKKEAVSRTVDAAKQDDLIDKLINRYSSWYRLRKAVAWLLRFKRWLLQHKPRTLGDVGATRLTVAELQEAELALVRYVQRKSYRQEFRDLATAKTAVQRQSSIHSLEPYLDSSGIMRIGGRIRLAPIEENRKFPAILPRDHHLSGLVVHHAHESSGHSGKEYVLSLIRRQFWIPKARPLINRILRGCVVCKRLRGLTGEQRMADLPVCRVTPGKPPFTYVGVDCFGPFYVKRGRSREKRYGCLFTCLSIRAIHIETLHSLEADSFLNAFIRFTARRGTPERVHSDNGTNFVGGEKELRAAIKHLNEDKQSQGFLLSMQIKWEFNPPGASHMGGVWERQIRTVRKVLNSLLHNQVLDDERLDTLFCEVESIVNDRPITAVSDDPKDLEALTPNHLLKLRVGHPVPLHGMKGTDKYGKRWKHVQYLVCQFWKRWISEYLPTLQRRQRWIHPQRNFQTGDIVLVRDDNLHRNQWPLGRVTKTFPGGDGLVRSVELKTAAGSLVRPITKLCLLESIQDE